LLAVPLALGFTITIIVKWKNMAEHNEPTPPTGGTNKRMRLWSLHPKYLDPQGLVALWREALWRKLLSW
jgi:hypothetical protein